MWGGAQGWGIHEALCAGKVELGGEKVLWMDLALVFTALPSTPGVKVCRA